MAGNGNPNIIPFDDARRMASMRSSRVSADTMAEAVGSPLHGGDARSARHASLRQDSRVSSRGGSSYATGARSSFSSSSFSAGTSRPSRDIRLAGESRDAVRSGYRVISSGSPARRSEGLSADARFHEGPRAALEVYDADAADEDARPSRSRDRRKDKAKQKAARLFERQFGADSPEPSPHSSRAAVYKGEMGRSHKRAFADLESDRRRTAAARGASSRRARREERSGISPLFIVAGIMACFVFASGLLFPAARQLYIETREQARLQAEYDAVFARNAAIEERIDHLKTEEGIEDAAHKELGWVYEGQVSGVVQGLDEDASSGEASDMVAQVKSGSVAAPETWYSPVLDVLFGYVDPSKAKPENADLSNVSDVAAEQPQADSKSS